jgi:undecaprenyl diphosphate synthase
MNSTQAAALTAGVDLSALPKHIGIIMDGNGRWAKARGLPRLLGHREGYKTLRSILLSANDLGIRFLTVFAFSAENWRRPQEEVAGLMQLIEQAAIDELRVMHQNNVRVLTSGRLRELPEGLRSALKKGVETTADNTGITFTLAVSYGGRAEIVDAVNRLIAEGMRSVDENAIANHLYNPQTPEPDLLIRTAGEMRLSNFMLWQSAYAELWVVEKPWPEFEEIDLLIACKEYQARVRKFGGLE